MFKTFLIDQKNLFKNPRSFTVICDHIHFNFKYNIKYSGTYQQEKEIVTEIIVSLRTMRKVNNLVYTDKVAVNSSIMH